MTCCRIAGRRSLRSSDTVWVSGQDDLPTRLRKGQVLPDFFIGAHSAVEGWPLLTRDANRFKTYFPALDVIAP